MPLRSAKPWLLPALLPLLAALALASLFLHGASCGHDFSFHLESWLEAARSLRHGDFDPAWAAAPAFNAGEPRFLFYPPLSWTLGAALTLLLPFAAVPLAYTWLVLSAAGLSLYFVAKRFVPDHAAFLAAALYLANPYTLFTATERTAFAELLAAAILPWLLGAALERNPRWHRLAWPLALLWLTNAPAAVMGSYTLLLLGLVRLAQALHQRENLWPTVRNFSVGAAFGLALPAFYLLPAAYERRFVQIAMAVTPGLSVPQNFLWASTADPGHDFVNHQAAHIAVALLAFTAVAILTAWLQPRKNSSSPNAALPGLTALAALIGFLLFRISQPLWNHLPELLFLQFPWRWLSVLAAVAALTASLSLRSLPKRWSIPLAVAAALLLGQFPGRHYLYACDANETPRSMAALFASSHGVPPTDEYTPGLADNDVLRPNLPPFWLTPDPTSEPPNSIPNPNETQPDKDFGAPPPSETLSQPAPHTLTIQAPRAEFLVLHLRDYPNWVVTRTGPNSNSPNHPAHIDRDDGLIAIAVPAGTSTLTIRWQTGRDRELGFAISLLALALFILCIRRSRRIVH